MTRYAVITAGGLYWMGAGFSVDVQDAVTFPSMSEAVLAATRYCTVKDWRAEPVAGPVRQEGAA